MTADKVVTIRLSSEDLDRLQRLADKAGITRHKFITNLIKTGIETLEELESVGLVRLALMARNAEEYLKSIGKKKEAKPTKMESPQT